MQELAKDLQSINTIKAPDWAAFVKTSPARQRTPANNDWWYMRSASLLRVVGTMGPIGVNKLRRKYGGKQRRGYASPIFVRAGGSIIRKSLQQLEKAGLIKHADMKGHKGKVLTPQGQSLLAQTAKRVAQHESGQKS